MSHTVRRMRVTCRHGKVSRRAVFCGAMLLVALGLCHAIAHAHEHHIETVSMRENGFSPVEITIARGTLVRFMNAGRLHHWPASDKHPTHEAYPTLDPRRPVQPGTAWEFRFDTSGVWHFHDHLFPHLGGTITVVDGPHDAYATTASSSEHASFSTIELSQSLLRQMLFALQASLEQLLVTLRRLLTRTGEGQGREHEEGAPVLAVTTRCLTHEYACHARVLRDVVVSIGPEQAIADLAQSKADSSIASSVDDHQLAHEIGRATAEAYGSSAEAFLRCPMSSFNGGCQHGFFEYVLGKTESTAVAAETICEGVREGFSAKFYFYCYHGVGHGVMMAEAYDLDRALATCDTLASPVGRDGCHQGVFMENVNAAMRGSSRAGLFSREDPLAPCNSLPEHYRHECYLNHAGWLVGVVFPHGVGEASARCLDAGAFIGPCMESIGLMVTNPAWQASLTAPGVPGEFDAETRASELCEQFPPAWQHSCVRGAVDNVLNFDELDISRAARFCALVPDILADTCFETIGRNVARQARTEKTAREICGSPVSIRASAACLRGAGL